MFLFTMVIVPFQKKIITYESFQIEKCFSFKGAAAAAAVAAAAQ